MPELELDGAQPERCTATTAQGRQCKRSALPGLVVCHVHAGASVGRPTLLTPELQTRMLQALRAGGYVQSACAVAGVALRTYEKWIVRGDPAGTRREDAMYREFREKVQRARAEAETRNVAIIAQAATENWQAAAWLLERAYPERWARPSQRMKPDDEPVTAADDPFAEVDELARRRQHPA